MANLLMAREKAPLVGRPNEVAMLCFNGEGISLSRGLVAGLSTSYTPMLIPGCAGKGVVKVSRNTAVRRVLQ